MNFGVLKFQCDMSFFFFFFFFGVCDGDVSFHDYRL